VSLHPSKEAIQALAAQVPDARNPTGYAKALLTPVYPVIRAEVIAEVVTALRSRGHQGWGGRVCRWPGVGDFIERYYESEEAK
jgi:hypothetical protein